MKSSSLQPGVVYGSRVRRDSDTLHPLLLVDLVIYQLGYQRSTLSVAHARARARKGSYYGSSDIGYVAVKLPEDMATDESAVESVLLAARRIIQEHLDRPEKDWGAGSVNHQFRVNGFEKSFAWFLTAAVSFEGPWKEAKAAHDEKQAQERAASRARQEQAAYREQEFWALNRCWTALFGVERSLGKVYDDPAFVRVNKADLVTVLDKLKALGDQGEAQ